MILTMNTEKSTTTKERARILDVGRPKIRPADEDTTLSFKASAALIKALDVEAARMSDEKPAGSARVSRSEAIKIILNSWIADHSKPRQ
jgi:hypothetical protein